MPKNNYFCLIMAGGVGRRFWPCSRKALPKQFLDFFGMGKSFLRMTYDRYRQIVPEENIYVSTHVDYRELVTNIIPELKGNRLICEDERRNTAPAITYAMRVISRDNPEATVVVAPCDHLILKDDEFRESILRGLDFASRYDKLLTIGIRPGRPETGYGYIQIGERDENEPDFYKVKTFIERPAREFAEMFVQSNEFFWNSGIFLWSIKTIERALAEHTNNISQYTDREDPDFASCPNISIDFSLLEKADNVYVQICDFGWAHLNTWESLYEAAPKDRGGNVVLNCNTLLYDCRNNVIALPKGKLAVLQGLEGFLVAISGDVLLVCRKDDQNAIRKFINDVEMRFGEKFS